MVSIWWKCPIGKLNLNFKTSSGGNVQISQSSATSSQSQTSGSSTPISLVNTKSLILNQTAPNQRLTIPIVVSNQIDSNSAKLCTQNQNKVTLQSFKSFIDNPSSSSLKNTSIHNLIVSAQSNQPKAVGANVLGSQRAKIVVPSGNKTTSGQATTIAQMCANLKSNQYKIQTNSPSQQLISQIIPNSIRFVPSSPLVNSAITTTANSSSSNNAVTNPTQSPSSSPLKPNIIRKTR